MMEHYEISHLGGTFPHFAKSRAVFSLANLLVFQLSSPTVLNIKSTNPREWKEIKKLGIGPEPL